MQALGDFILNMFIYNQLLIKGYNWSQQSRPMILLLTSVNTLIYLILNSTELDKAQKHKCANPIQSKPWEIFVH